MKHFRRLFFGIIAILICHTYFSSTLLAQKDSLDGVMVLKNLTVIDVRSGALVPKQTVVIQGNRIVSIGPSKAAEDRSKTPAIDCSGLYAIPRLWDMHVHLVFGDWFPGGKNISLPLFVANGVTSVRDMGSELEVIQKWRGEIESGKLIGPRIYSPGPMLDGPKPRFPSSVAITTAEDGRRAVDDLKKRGADFIKLQSLIPRDAVFAIADEAKKQNITFVG